MGEIYMKIDRREFLKLAGMGCVVFVSGLGNLDQSAHGADMGKDDFFFIQISDTHWGFTNPAVNPDAKGTLKKAINAVNSLKYPPNFIVFTGDLSHTTDDDNERRRRLSEFHDIVKTLKVKDIRFLAGEHDAGLDYGKAFQEFFGKTHYTFDYNKVHFIVLDNVSKPNSILGDDQLQWLNDDLKLLDKNSRIIVLTHRPLFDLNPEWDWHTQDGAKAIELLMPFRDVTVFYGHIHQEHHHMTGHIAHHAAKGTMYPLPVSGSVPKKQPVPWNPSEPYKGLGYRGIDVKSSQKDLTVMEFGIKEGNV
ncbi:MAG: 3',5'-cyclic-AMP phosphodiesterase [Syntrophus sp. SKADARSKE-3]|nr:3',5'-cyclic-AMP phosphodiesterase [Syntrophus sp. SKADARSKE-3]